MAVCAEAVCAVITMGPSRCGRPGAATGRCTQFPSTLQQFRRSGSHSGGRTGARHNDTHIDVHYGRRACAYIL